MVLEAINIRSDRELVTNSPKQGDDLGPLSAPESSTTNFPVIEARDPHDVASDNSTTGSMRMYADELTATELLNAQALRGLSLTNDQREESVCRAYFATSDTFVPSNDVTVTTSEKNLEAPVIATSNDEHLVDKQVDKPVVCVVDDVVLVEEQNKDLTSTDEMKEIPAVEEIIMDELVQEKSVEIEEETIRTELMEEKSGEIIPMGVTQEAETVGTDEIPEPVLEASTPESIEASFSKHDKLVVEPEATVGAADATLSSSNEAKKKKVRFFFASSLAAKNFSNSLSRMSKPTVPKASLSKMAKMQSVSKLSSSVVSGSLNRLQSLPKSPRSLPRLPRKLSKPSFVKNSKTMDKSSSPVEEDVDIAMPKDSDAVKIEPIDANSQCPTEELEGSTCSIFTESKTVFQVRLALLFMRSVE